MPRKYEKLLVKIIGNLASLQPALITANNYKDTKDQFTPLILSAKELQHLYSFLAKYYVKEADFISQISQAKLNVELELAEVFGKTPDEWKK